MNTNQDRAQGALVGAFIGEAQGGGPHWYYDLNELQSKYGAWIDDYTAPQSGRYHAGIKPGELSQQSWIIFETARFMSEHAHDDHDSYFKMMDDVILPKLDGTPMGGYGGYTSQVMRHLYQKRIV
jgi:ADP-ribosylglycohydrolase